MIFESIGTDAFRQISLVLLIDQHRVDPGPLLTPDPRFGA
jgi:hypothetical protein